MKVYLHTDNGVEALPVTEGMTIIVGGFQKNTIPEMLTLSIVVYAAGREVVIAEACALESKPALLLADETTERHLLLEPSSSYLLVRLV